MIGRYYEPDIEEWLYYGTDEDDLRVW